MKNGNVSQDLTKAKEMAALSKPYLVFYNTVQTAGWSYILFQTINLILKHKSAVGLWKTVGTSVVIFQTLAALEVIHCILRLVHSNPVTTFVQVASRVIQVWGIMMPIEKVHNSPTLALTLFAWGVTEVVRYSYYCAQLVGKPSKLHTWCRYSFFYGLYPAGVTGEISNIILSLDTIKKRQLFSIMLPNPFNISFSYYYANFFLILSYIPFFPVLFYHMVRQRRKVLDDSPKKDK